MKIEYRQHGDVLLPNLTLKPENEVQPGKYGLMRRQFLKEHRNYLFQEYLMDQSLNQHLMEIEQTAQKRKTQLVNQLKTKDGITEQLKNADIEGTISNLEAMDIETLNKAINDLYQVINPLASLFSRD